ncbi:MAG: TonB family protein [Acidobacteriota bacterium]|nr:TonB family protein [Acidobacteriota bacterium]
MRIPIAPLSFGLALSLALAAPGMAPSAGATAPPVVNEPARRAGGPLPPQSSQAVGWEQAMADLAVDASGGVSQVRMIESTPGFDDRFLGALKQWTFKPATRQGKPVASDVFVVAIYRPPVLYNVPTLGQSPRRLGTAADDAPYALNMLTPQYPPLGVGDGTVLVEARVAADGTVSEAHAAGGVSGFDATAVAAAQKWTFRPARVDGTAADAYAYIIFGFRQPVQPGKGKGR